MKGEQQPLLNFDGLPFCQAEDEAFRKNITQKILIQTKSKT
jgi:hypothetical protein